MLIFALKHKANVSWPPLLLVSLNAYRHRQRGREGEKEYNKTWSSSSNPEDRHTLNPAWLLHCSPAFNSKQKTKPTIDCIEPNMIFIDFYFNIPRLLCPDAVKIVFFFWFPCPFVIISTSPLQFGCETCGNVGSELNCYSKQLLQFEKKAEHSAFLHKDKKCKTAELSQPQAMREAGPSAQVVHTGERDPDELWWLHFRSVRDSGLKVSCFCEWRFCHSEALK